MEHFELREKDWYIKYLNAFYFSTVTMATVGYGDITPQTHFEKLQCIFTMFICCGVFAYTLNSIGIIVQELNKAEQRNKEKLFKINNYMFKNSISVPLQF